MRPPISIAGAAISLTIAFAAAAGDPATAEVLFREGRALLLEGRVDQACPKLAESVALDPSSGSLLNLALCYEKQNRLATAWATYVNAGRVARAQGIPERIEEADARANELEGRLGHIAFTPNSRYSGLTVRRDGEAPVALGALGSTIPVDAGHHQLVFNAPHYRAKTIEIDTRDGESATVYTPDLEAESVAQEPVVLAPRVRQIPPTRTPLGPLVVGGLGVAALLAGTATGIVALDSYGRAEALCPAHVGCSTPALDLRERAEREAWATNVLLGVGIVALTVGVIYWLMNSRTSAQQASLWEPSF